MTDQTKTIYAGISAYFTNRHISAIAVAFRDTTYLLDFIEHQFRPDQADQPHSEAATSFIVSKLKGYGKKHLEKIVGLAMSQHVAERCPGLCSRLWAELDIIPLVLPESSQLDKYTHPRSQTHAWDARTVDEQAESMSRKCVM